VQFWVLEEVFAEISLVSGFDIVSGGCNVGSGILSLGTWLRLRLEKLRSEMEEW